MGTVRCRGAGSRCAGNRGSCFFLPIYALKYVSVSEKRITKKICNLLFKKKKTIVSNVQRRLTNGEAEPRPDSQRVRNIFSSILWPTRWKVLRWKIATKRPHRSVPGVCCVVCCVGTMLPRNENLLAAALSPRPRYHVTIFAKR